MMSERSVSDPAYKYSLIVLQADGNTHTYNYDDEEAACKHLDSLVVLATFGVSTGVVLLEHPVSRVSLWDNETNTRLAIFEIGGED